MTKPRILVTGGFGFIGSCLVRFLNDLGYKKIVVVDDIHETHKWKNLERKHVETFVPKDKLEEYLATSPELQAIVHLGACSDTMVTDGDYVMANNYHYSVRLCEWAVNRGVRFIYASSAATYGSGEQGFEDDLEHIEILAPLNLYAFSKQRFDLWVKEQGLFDRVVGLKYFNIFGPNEGHKGRMASMVYKMVPIAQNDRVIQLFKSTEPDKFKDGEQQRDFLYVKDAVAMTHAFIENSVGGLFNIGSGHASTWKELATALFKALNLPTQIEYIDMPPTLVKAYQNYTCADMTRYNTLVGITPRFSLEAGVIDYVRNHLVPGVVW